MKDFEGLESISVEVKLTNSFLERENLEDGDKQWPIASSEPAESSFTVELTRREPNIQNKLSLTLQEMLLVRRCIKAIQFQACTSKMAFKTHQKMGEQLQDHQQDVSHDKSHPQRVANFISG